MTLFVRRKLIFDKNLRRNSRAAAKELASTVRFWFRKKHNIPPTDDRYLNMTEEGMLTEYWAHYYYDQPAGETEVETDNYEDQLAAMDAEMGILPDDFEEVNDD